MMQLDTVRRPQFYGLILAANDDVKPVGSTYYLRKDATVSFPYFLVFDS